MPSLADYQKWYFLAWVIRMLRHYWPAAHAKKEGVPANPAILLDSNFRSREKYKKCLVKQKVTWYSDTLKFRESYGKIVTSATNQR